MNRRLGAAWLALLVLSLSATAAQAERHAIAARAGLLGLGVEYAFAPTDFVSVRLGLNGAEFGFDAEESGIDYDFDFVWDSVSVAVDLHPLRGKWRVSAGVLRNDNRLEAVGQLAGNVTVGDNTYTADELGRLSGRIEFDDTAPFASVGWDWSKRKRFGVSLDLGVVKQGTPKVTLAASGPIAGVPDFQQDILREQQELQESLDDFDLLPFATLGLVFRF